MGTGKKYGGYKAFQYLEPGKDYRAFKLAKATDRVEPYRVELTAEQENRVNEIAAEYPVISLHEHPVLWVDDMEEVFEYNREGRHFAAYEALAESCLDAVFDNLMDGVCTITSKGGWKWTDVIHDLGIRLCDLAQQDFLIRCETVDDIRRAHDEGRIALVPSLESATMIENEIDRLEVLYGFGVRLMGLVYSEANVLGSGLKEKNDGGLTHFGHQVVERLNKIGMAIDVSHCGEQTAMDAVVASSKPIFITHTGARALWDAKRLKTDEVIKACAEKGGVIGIEAAPHTTITKKNDVHSVESFMEHFEYVKDLVGIDHVSFGPDTLYGDHVGLHHAFAGHLSIKQAFTMHKEVPFVKGLENPSESSWNIIRWLVGHDYSEADIAKVIGGNTIRVLEEVWVR